MSGSKAKRAALVTFLALATNCTYVRTLDAGRSIKVVSTPPPNCEDVGDVAGSSGGSGAPWAGEDKLMNNAINDARNKAAKLGATHITTNPPQFAAVNGTVVRAIVVSKAYRCQ
jgi:hypothetical protein